MKSRFLSQLALFSLATIFMVSCGKKIQLEDHSFETMIVKKSDRTLDVPYSAKVTGLQDVSILPQVTGKITEIAVREGQHVTIGQVLFVIDPVPFQLDLENAIANTAAAKAQLSTAKLNYESNKDLFEKNIVSRYVLETAANQYESAQAALAQAKAKENRARNDLNYCTVVSPVNGVVGNLPYRVGDLVSPSIVTPLTEVSDVTIAVANFSINESDYTYILQTFGDRLKTGVGYQSMPDVRFKLKDGTIYDTIGRITRVSGVVDATTGTVICKADFPNPKGILSSGISGSVLFPVLHKDIIIIPQTATMQLQDKITVYKVSADSTAHLTIIEVSAINDGKEYIVTKGLEEGDEIVTLGVNNVQDGAKVKF